MAYTFPADVAQLIRERMASDQFGTEDDVLRAALSALSERRQMR